LATGTDWNNPPNSPDPTAGAMDDDNDGGWRGESRAWELERWNGRLKIGLEKSKS
jgi:hypothetical protein